MGRRTWVKIFCEKWLRGTIREEKPEIRAVWIDLLVLAGDSAYGDHGIIGLAPNCGLTDEQICNILNIPPKLWNEAKQKFIKTKRICTNRANEITILNWKKYQSEYQRQKVYRKTTTSKVTNKSDKQELPKEREREGEGDKNISNSIKKRIDFNFNKEIWENITDKDKQGWKEAYPACNIDMEITRMKEWLISNPEKRKIRYRRFITNWLSRSQDKGGTKYKKQNWKPPCEE